MDNNSNSSAHGSKDLSGWEHFLWFSFSFKGRLNRKPYIIFGFIVNALYLAIMFMTVTYDKHSREILEVIFALVFIWPVLAIQAKRWHDIDRSAWWILISFVPIIGPVVTFYRTFVLSGTDGPNRYGEDPLEGVQKKYVYYDRNLTPKELKIAAIAGVILLVFLIVFFFYNVELK